MLVIKFRQDIFDQSVHVLSPLENCCIVEDCLQSTSPLNLSWPHQFLLWLVLVRLQGCIEATKLQKIVKEDICFLHLKAGSKVEKEKKELSCFLISQRFPSEEVVIDWEAICQNLIKWCVLIDKCRICAKFKLLIQIPLFLQSESYQIKSPKKIVIKSVLNLLLFSWNTFFPSWMSNLNRFSLM